MGAAAAGCGGAAVAPGGDAGLREGDPPGRNCGKVPPRLVGSYYVRLTPAELPPEAADAPTGIQLLLLGPEHHAFSGGKHDGRRSAPVCLTRHTVRFPEEARGRCAGRGDAIYRWWLRGDELRLIRVREACVARAVHHTTHPYRRFNASGWNCVDRPRCDHKFEQVELLERTGSCAEIGC